MTDTNCDFCEAAPGSHMSDCPALHATLRGQSFEMPMSNRLRDLLKREPLVQEVIRLGEREMFVDKDGSIGEYQDALNELRDAIVALAEWKP